MRDDDASADAPSADRTAPIGDAEVAAALRVGLLAGLFTHEQVVAWADRRIEAEERPAEWLIHLSMARDVNVAVTVLGDSAKGADVDVVQKIVVSAIRRRSDVERAAEEVTRLICRVAYGLLIDSDSGSWTIYNEAVNIESDLDTMRFGRQSNDFVRQAVADLRDLLRRHALPPGADDPLSNL